MFIHVAVSIPRRIGTVPSIGSGNHQMNPVGSVVFPTCLAENIAEVNFAMADSMLSFGNLEISLFTAISLSIVSLIFIVSFLIVGLKNDTQGLMQWIQNKKRS